MRRSRPQPLRLRCGQADGHRLRVPVQAFRLGQRDHGAADPSQPRGGDALHRDLPHEIGAGQAAADPCGAGGRQHVIGADGVIAGDLRRPLSDEQ